MTWMFISLLLGFSMLTFNSNFFTKLSIPFYLVMIFLLLLTFLVAREINGARSWLQIGPVQFQPAEFAKTATALMLAKYISTLTTPEKSFKQKLIAGAIVLVPMGIIILQEDMGSALVYTSLAFVLYREGFKVREVVIALLFGAGWIIAFCYGYWPAQPYCIPFCLRADFGEKKNRKLWVSIWPFYQVSLLL
jgi:rod shape determining protein RodA